MPMIGNAKRMSFILEEHVKNCFWFKGCSITTTILWSIFVMSHFSDELQLALVACTYEARCKTVLFVEVFFK